MKCLKLPMLLFFVFFTLPQSFSQQLNVEQLSKASFSDIDSLSIEYYTQGDFHTCIAVMAAGKKKAQQLYGSQDSTYAVYTNYVGFFHFQVGEFDKAETFLLEAVDVIKAISGEHYAIYGDILNNLASVYEYTNQVKKAEKAYLLAIQLQEVNGHMETQGYGNSIGYLASLYDKTSDFERAEPLFQRAIQLRAKIFGKDHPSYAFSLNDLAILYEKMAYLEQAEALYEEALKIMKNALGITHPSYAITLSNLADLYENQGKFVKAEKMHHKAQAVKAEKFGKMHPAYGRGLAHLASIYSNKKNYTEAINTYKEVLRIYGATYGKTHPSYASMLNNLGFTHSTAENYLQAEKFYLQALTVFEQSQSVQHPDYLNTLNNLAKNARKNNQIEKSWAYSIRCIQQATQQFNLGHQVTRAWADSIQQTDFHNFPQINKTITSLFNLYTILEISKQSKEQEQIITSLAIHIIKRSRDQHFSPSDKLWFFKKTSQWVANSLKSYDKETQIKKAFLSSEHTKAALLYEATKTERAYEIGSLPDSLIKKEKFLLQRQQKLRAFLAETRPEQEKDSVESLLIDFRIKFKNFQQSIEKKYPKYAQLKYQENKASIQDVQQLLDPKTAFIDYLIGPSSIHIFYIDQQNARWVEQKLPTELLDNRIKRFHRYLSNYDLLSNNESKSYQGYTEIAHWFYQNLLEPVLKDAKGIEQLILVTDGKLGHLPFETFLVDAPIQGKINYEELHYLIKEFSISYHYSAALFVDAMNSPKTNNNGQILAMASNYSIDPNNNQKNRLPAYQRLREELPSLPDARIEVENLATYFDGYFAYDKEAVERNFKSKASDYAIIHLAMHGLLNNKAPILSSLAFSEDGDSLENNFLQAYEISKMNLNADLVVLSACETGMGKVEVGNGIASLARSFMYAGAASLVVSLWQVNDYATSLIMEYFYKNLALGMSKSEALRQAKLNYIDTHQGVSLHPAFWSAFIQFGNNDPILFAQKGNKWPWLIGAGGFSFVLLLVGLKQRKK